MRSTTIAIAAATLVVIVAIGAVAAWGITNRSEALDSMPTDTPDGATVEAVPDGELFAFVTPASTRDDDRVVIRVDPAELLTGAKAHEAAVDAGVINADEALPNDVFIIDPDPRTGTIALRDDAVITIQIAPAGEPLRPFEIGPDELYDAFNGALAAGAVYDIIPGEPVPMTLTVERGSVVSAVQVLLP